MNWRLAFFLLFHAGALLADVVRYLLATLITFAVGIAMGWRPDPVGVIGSTLLVLVCSFAVSWIFALMGCLMSKASTVQGVSMLIMFPLTFMSNAFVPVDTMPGWLQGFVKVNPISHLVTAVRELCTNGHVGVHVVWSLVGAGELVGTRRHRARARLAAVEHRPPGGAQLAAQGTQPAPVIEARQAEIAMHQHDRRIGRRRASRTGEQRADEHRRACLQATGTPPCPGDRAADRPASITHGVRTSRHPARFRAPCQATAVSRRQKPC